MSPFSNLKIKIFLAPIYSSLVWASGMLHAQGGHAILTTRLRTVQHTWWPKAGASVGCSGRLDVRTRRELAGSFGT
jgi:hypothetical protein